MNRDFRERVLLPVALPIALVLGFGVFAFALSRILLTVSELLSVVIAMFVATYILIVGAFVARNQRITSRALGAGLAVGLFGIVAAGAVAGAAGMRELHVEGGNAEDEGGEGAVADGSAGEGGADAGEGAGAAPEIPDDAVTFVAIDIDYEQAPTEVPAGDVVFALENSGAILHNVVLEEPGDVLVVEAQGGETAVQNIQLEPGDYTYFCSVPGHRQAGMEGTFTVA